MIPPTAAVPSFEAGALPEAELSPLSEFVKPGPRSTSSSVPPPALGHEELPDFSGDFDLDAVPAPRESHDAKEALTFAATFDLDAVPVSTEGFGHDELPTFDARFDLDAVPEPAKDFGHEEIPAIPEDFGHEEIPAIPEDFGHEEIPALEDDEAALGDIEEVNAAPAGDLLPDESVTAFTRSLVTTMNKSTYYEPGHPAHFAVRDELYGALLGLLATEDQIGYVLQRSNPPEILVDGPAGRVALNEIMPAGVYSMIVPRFIEYFDRHDLVTLAFRRGLSLQEFERFITIWTRPGAHHRDRGTLSDELINESVVHVSTVSTGELGLDETELPWQVRVCLARLRRDLRTVPLFSTLDVEALRQIKRQIFSDVVRPLRDVIQLRMLIEFAPSIEKQLASLDDVRDIDIAASVIDAVQDNRLSELTLALLQSIDRAQGEVLLRLSGVVAGCAISLLTRDSDGSYPALRALMAREMVTFDELPEGLRDELTVERMLKEFESGTLTEVAMNTPHDLRLLGRLVARVFDVGRHDDAARLVAPLVDESFRGGEMRDEAARVLGACVPDSALDALVVRLEAEHDDMAREPLARLLQSLSNRGARALVHRIVTHPPSARIGVAWHVLDRMGSDTQAAVNEALLGVGVSPAALRVLILLAQAHPSAHSVGAILQHTEHAVASVRVAALVAISTLWGPKSANALTTALEDPAPEVVALALLGLIERAGAPEVARAHAIKLLAAATSRTPRDLCFVAIRAACVFGADDPERGSVVAALEHLLEPERPSGAFGIGRAPPMDPEVIEAVHAALERLNATASRPPPAPSQPPGSLFQRIFRGS